jgi:hypothetical protein
VAWPPTLADLKVDAGIDADDVRDDDSNEQNLAAAVSFIERVHTGRYTFTGTPTVDVPAPPADMELGTVRLALRWKARRRSADALIAMGELGASRVPSFDPDIDRMCRLGRYAPAVFA